MIILFKGYNNHSNRLFQTIHIKSFCLEHGLTFYNPSIWDMERYYGHEKTFFDFIVSKLLYILSKIGLIRPLRLIDDTKYNFYCKMFLSKKTLFIKGWMFRNNELTKKYQKQLSNEYTLLPKFYENNPLYNIIKKIDRSSFNLIGVHIRRGDYKIWQNGMYYFEDDVYQKYITNLDKVLLKQTGKDSIFILFSNENIAFKESEKVIISKNTWYIDQFIMSKCDYLIGPLSTFTLWASYVGDAKYFHMQNSTGNIQLNDFCKCEG